MNDIENFMFVLFLFSIFAIPFFTLYSSGISKSTRELKKLNAIHKRFNNGGDIEQIEKDIFNGRWKYHKDKLELLYMFITIKKDLINKKKKQGQEVKTK